MKNLDNYLTDLQIEDSDFFSENEYLYSINEEDFYPASYLHNSDFYNTYQDLLDTI